MDFSPPPSPRVVDYVPSETPPASSPVSAMPQLDFPMIITPREDPPAKPSPRVTAPSSPRAQPGSAPAEVHTSGIHMECAPEPSFAYAHTCSYSHQVTPHLPPQLSGTHAPSPRRPLSAQGRDGASPRVDSNKAKASPRRDSETARGSPRGADGPSIEANAIPQGAVVGGAKKRLSVTFPQLAPLPDDDDTKTKYETHDYPHIADDHW
jgi:hypothetical protein